MEDARWGTHGEVWGNLQEKAGTKGAEWGHAWKVASYWDEDEAWEGAFEIATAILEDYEDEADIDDLVASLSESAFFGIEVGAGRE